MLVKFFLERSVSQTKNVNKKESAFVQHIVPNIVNLIETKLTTTRLEIGMFEMCHALSK